ncbi:MAG: bifunctional folylpolyglutamate synthase/dihydrofolate synthase, partial [Flavobacteriales bacterium]|nr:bifunctional folylpolyglutamate synthase/dihydrofolate synthase [Flavobacteriales bacterium]
MTYAETLDYLFSQLPMYQRQGAPAFKKDLTNTLALCELLDNPHQKFKSIHVAGTNGKGSVSHMLASVFHAAGYKVGLYTSPHLKDFRERIKINGEMISEESVIGFVEKYKADFERIQPSFFEMTVALAFDHFAKNEVDIAIIEVGLGGRLDSTNVITPELSVITNIGYDHQQFLGETLPEIAGEKAGIIKQNIPVVVGEFQQEVAEVFENKARETNSRLRFANREWEIRDAELLSNAVDDYSLKMKVRHYD